MGHDPSLPMHGGVALISVNFGSHALLAANLGSVDLEAVGATVYVVDNPSSQAERVAVRRLARARGWRLIESPCNDGFGSGVNLGAESAIADGCDVLVTLNPDVQVTEATLRTLVGAVRADVTVAVSPTIIRPDGRAWFRGAVVDVRAGRTRAIERPAEPDSEHTWLSGACLALTASLWNCVGGFDERFFMYWEDVDLSFRIIRAGGGLRVLDAVAVHDPGGTQAADGVAKSDLYYRYNCRNRLLFAAAHLDAPDVRHWRRRTLAYAREVLLRGGRRQFVRRPLLPLLAAARGSYEGLRLSRPGR